MCGMDYAGGWPELHFVRLSDATVEVLVNGPQLANLALQLARYLRPRAESLFALPKP